MTAERQCGQWDGSGIRPVTGFLWISGYQSINPWSTPQFPHPLRSVWTSDFCDDGSRCLHSDMKHSHLSQWLSSTLAIIDRSHSWTGEGVILMASVTLPVKPTSLQAIWAGPLPPGTKSALGAVIFWEAAWWFKELRLWKEMDLCLKITHELCGPWGDPMHAWGPVTTSIKEGHNTCLVGFLWV